jgi:hypothetical protein
MPTEQYDINVWNRPDPLKNNNQLAYALGYQNFKTFKTIGDVPGLLLAPNSGQQRKYLGETIPAYAVMRVAGPAVWIDDKLTYPVCLPDDLSQGFQQAGCHFINGATPIPIDGIGSATQTLPAQVLVDMTPNSPAQTYGLTPAQQLGQRPLGDIMTPLGILSGCWALHNFNDILNSNQAILNEWPQEFPYSLVSYVPIRQLDSKGKLQYTQPYAMVGSGGSIYVLTAGQLAGLVG